MTAIIILAVLAALTLAAGGFVLRRRTPAEDTADLAVSSDTPGFTRRTVVGTALAAITVPFAAVAAQDGDDNDRVPEEDELATPWATPDVPQCREDATPDASDPEEDPDCIRGEVPKHIAIAAIGVDADIEIQEIIAGELQDPTGPTLVTWYKETSRLGERGNGVYAGHLNYWGVPEGVFFAIKTLQPGEEIVLTGENDEEFVYAVQWVENQPGQDDPEPEVLGLTEDEAITLITCGGEWDTTIAEYNERTTVRAIRRKPEPAS
jgi:sortase (surface protein transpeptidase)